MPELKERFYSEFTGAWNAGSRCLNLAAKATIDGVRLILLSLCSGLEKLHAAFDMPESQRIEDVAEGQGWQ